MFNVNTHSTRTSSLDAIQGPTDAELLAIELELSEEEALTTLEDIEMLDVLFDLNDLGAADD